MSLLYPWKNEVAESSDWISDPQLIQIDDPQLLQTCKMETLLTMLMVKSR